MQGSSPQPCRRCDCPAQAGWPHGGARREALCDAVRGDRATRRGLTPGEGGLAAAGGSWDGRIVMLLMISVLTGCSVANGTPTAAPVTGSHSAGPTSSPPIGGAAEIRNASPTSPSVPAPASVPRSLPFTGTEPSTLHPVSLPSG